MAKPAPLTVELSPQDRARIDRLIRALNAAAKTNEKTIKRRLTEPLDTGEGDWQLNIDEKAGEDD